MVTPWVKHSMTTKLAREQLNSKFHGLMLLKFYDPVDYLLHFVCEEATSHAHLAVARAKLACF